LIFQYNKAIQGLQTVNEKNEEPTLGFIILFPFPQVEGVFLYREEK